MLPRAMIEWCNSIHLFCTSLYYELSSYCAVLFGVLLSNSKSFMRRDLKLSKVTQIIMLDNNIINGR